MSPQKAIVFVHKGLHYKGFLKDDINRHILRKVDDLQK